MTCSRCNCLCSCCLVYLLSPVLTNSKISTKLQQETTRALTLGSVIVPLLSLCIMELLHFTSFGFCLFLPWQSLELHSPAFCWSVCIDSLKDPSFLSGRLTAQIECISLLIRDRPKPKASVWSLPPSGIFSCLGKIAQCRLEDWPLCCRETFVVSKCVSFSSGIKSENLSKRLQTLV